MILFACISAIFFSFFFERLLPPSEGILTLTIPTPFFPSSRKKNRGDCMVSGGCFFFLLLSRFLLAAWHWLISLLVGQTNRIPGLLLAREL
jgi:hypothetical protein